MERKGLKQQEAYDIARREFYAERLREDIERRVAKEEAYSTGAYFGETYTQWGMELEDKIYDEFTVWAEKKMLEIENTRNATLAGPGRPEPTESALENGENTLISESEETQFVTV
jgi:small subunit ribosomal protein S23